MFVRFQYHGIQIETPAAAFKSLGVGEADFVIDDIK
jgi:hypothetical protein